MAKIGDIHIPSASHCLEHLLSKFHLLGHYIRPPPGLAFLLTSPGTDAGDVQSLVNRLGLGQWYGVPSPSPIEPPGNTTLMVGMDIFTVLGRYKRDFVKKENARKTIFWAFHALPSSIKFIEKKKWKE